MSVSSSICQEQLRSERLWIHQTIVPDYRLPVFRGLKDRLGDGFKLTCGGQWSSGGMNAPVPRDLVPHPLANRWLLGNRVLWQCGMGRHWRTPGLAIFEFNLRAPSTWITVRRRAQAGLLTGFWGHTSGRSRTGLAMRVRSWLLDRASCFVCYTETQASALRIERPNLSVLVAPNAVMHARDCWTPQLPVEQVTDVIYVGRLIREKKPELAIRGFAAAYKSGGLAKTSRLLMVGDGPERARSEALARELGVPCAFMGHVSDIDRLREFYATSLVSLSPGYVGLSATQSLAFGVPILVAKGEPHSPEIETCVDGETAAFFKQNSVPALASELGEIFRRREEWVRRRAPLAKGTAEKYSYERMINALLDARSRCSAPIKNH